MATSKRKVGAWDLSYDSSRPNTVYVDGPRWSDSGIMYHDGRVAWDFPERVPQTVRKAAAAMIRKGRKGASCE